MGNRLIARSPLYPSIYHYQPTTSRRFCKNVEANPTLLTGGKEAGTSVPDYVKIFGQVFSEEGFARLPNRKPWDHAIELTAGAQPKGCKVYTLSVTEQGEL